MSSIEVVRFLGFAIPLGLPGSKPLSLLSLGLVDVFVDLWQGRENLVHPVENLYAGAEEYIPILCFRVSVLHEGILWAGTHVGQIEVLLAQWARCIRSLTVFKASGRPFSPIWLVVAASSIPLGSSTAVIALFVTLREPFERRVTMVLLLFFDNVKRQTSCPRARSQPRRTCCGCWLPVPLRWRYLCLRYWMMMMMCMCGLRLHRIAIFRVWLLEYDRKEVLGLHIHGYLIPACCLIVRLGDMARSFLDVVAYDVRELLTQN